MSPTVKTQPAAAEPYSQTFALITMEGSQRGLHKLPNCGID